MSDLQNLIYCENEDLPLTNLSPFYAQIIADRIATLRAISRSEKLQRRLTASRTTAARDYAMPRSLKVLYEALIPVASNIKIAETTFQQLDGKPVPLVLDSGLLARSLRFSCERVFSESCSSLGVDPAPILSAWRDSGAQGASFVAMQGATWIVESPNLQSVSGLLRLAHEAGHWLCESQAGSKGVNSARRYFISEACATVFCRNIVSAALKSGFVTGTQTTTGLRDWDDYCDAEDFLNAHFFLLEASALRGGVSTSSVFTHAHLRDSWSMFFGYQVVNTVATVLAKTSSDYLWKWLRGSL